MSHDRYLKNLVREANDYGKAFPKGNEGTMQKHSSAKWAKTYSHRITRRTFTFELECD